LLELVPLTVTVAERWLVVGVMVSVWFWLVTVVRYATVPLVKPGTSLPVLRLSPLSVASLLAARVTVTV
jgi:hypothetical protein